MTCEWRPGGEQAGESSFEFLVAEGVRARGGSQRDCWTCLSRRSIKTR
jgi:hypothetical protein